MATVKERPVSSRAIGMFDSGLGGLTVMQQLIRTLPHEDVVYYGDTARIPYGGKSRETVVRYSMENTTFLIDKQVKVIVVACNTATSHALEVLQDSFGVPVIGVVDPGADYAAKVSAHGRIAVLGTRGTIASQSYQKAILQRIPDAEIVPIACPMFVPLVEEGYINHPAASLIVAEYLKPLKGKKVDTVLLGCTHYPLLKELIQREVGEGVTVIDSACACAEAVSGFLDVNEMKNACQQRLPSYRYYVSDDPDKFRELGSAFLGRAIPLVEKVPYHA